MQMSKREQQQKIKEQKQHASRQREQTRKLLIRVGMFGVAPVLLIFALVAIFSQGRIYSPVEIADNDHLRGVATTPVSIVVYADFQCPACATEHQPKHVEKGKGHNSPQREPELRDVCCREKLVGMTGKHKG